MSIQLKPRVHLAVLAASVVLGWVAGCGNSSNGVRASGGGSLRDAGAGTNDGASGLSANGDDAPAGCPPRDAAGPMDPGVPAGTRLQAGDALSVRGVTSDGYVIYSDDAALQLYAIALAGGNAELIASLGSKFWVTVVGQVVFAWSNVTGTNVGSLMAWSSSTHGHPVASASLGIVAAAASSGQQILYLDNVDAAGQTGDVYVAASDGTGAVKLLGGQNLDGCYPQLGFAGPYAVASHCDAARTGGPSSTISSFRSPSWTRVDLMTNAANIWSADDSSSRVLVSTSAGVLVVPIGGGQPTTIDAEGFLGQLIAGGSTAIYSTVSHALRISPVDTPAPVTLLQGFGGFHGLSADQRTLLYFQNFGSEGSDVYMASAAAPSTPITLWAAATGAVPGDSFTADSSYALYLTGMDVCTGTGAFNAFPVDGSNPIALGQNVWVGWSATGSKVIFNDNYVATGGLRSGRADIEFVDLAQTQRPARMVSQADAVISLSPSRDSVVYSWSAQPGALAGLYVYPIP